MPPSMPRWTRRRFLGGLVAGAGMAALPVSALARLGSEHRLALALVRPGSPEGAAALAGFDLTHARVGDAVEVLLWPGDGPRLDRLGLEWEITVPDVVARDRSQRAGTASVAAAATDGRTTYRRLVDYEDDLHRWADAHPDRARVRQLPRRTEEGRAVYALEIAADVRRQDGRPAFYMDGLHHAREWPSGELTMRFAHELLTSTRTRVAELLEHVRVIVVPVVNPDGFHHSRESLVEQEMLAVVAGGQGAYWRKNRRSLAHDMEAPRLDAEREINPTAYGADPNRNYPLLWGGPGASSSRLDQSHRGPAAASEPESHNVRSLVLEHQVTSLISNHTYGGLILRPWGHVADDSPDEPMLASLAERMAAINGYESIKGIELYPTTGTTDAWAYGVIGSLAYTLEHGESFHPPFGVVIDQYEANRGSFFEAAWAAAAPSTHGAVVGRVVDAAGRPAAATITVDRRIPTRTWEDGAVVERHRTLHDAPDGRIELHVCPSTPPFMAEAGDALPWTITVAALGRRRSLHREVVRGATVDLGEVVV